MLVERTAVEPEESERPSDERRVKIVFFHLWKSVCVLRQLFVHVIIVSN